MGTALLLFAGLVSCGEAPSVPAPPVLQALGITPAQLEFEPLRVGEVAEQTVSLENRGPAPLAISARIEPPFEVAPAEQLLPPGGEGTLVVRFLPSSSGPFRGELLLVFQGGEARVEVFAEAEPLTEDASCESGCGPGVVRDGACIPSGESLAPEWSYLPAADRDLVYDGLLDPAGNLYFVECTIGDERACELVSLDRDGSVRYRQLLEAGHVEAPTLSADRVLLATLGPARLEGLGAQDGAPQWTLELQAELSLRLGRPLEVAEVGALVDAGGGLVASVVRAVGRDQATAAALVGVERDTGAVRFVVELPGRGEGLVSDELGRLYLAHRGEGDDPERMYLASFWPDGQVRWSREVAALEDLGRDDLLDRPLAAFGGALVQVSGALIDADTGERRVQLPVDLRGLLFTPQSPVWGAPESALLIAGFRCEGTDCPAPRPGTFRFLYRVSADGELLWAHPTGAVGTAPLLLGGDGVLQVHGELRQDPARVLGYSDASYASCVTRRDPEGSLTLRHLLPGEAPYIAPPALSAGRLFLGAHLNWRDDDASNLQVGISAFDVDPGAPAQEGWITFGGSQQRGHRPAGAMGERLHSPRGW